MFSPSELGHDLTLYAYAWLSERMRLTEALAVEVAKSPAARPVHDLRVACRRLRAAIAFFHGVAEVPHLSDVDRAAKRLARSVGVLRELDVAQKQLKALSFAEGAEEAERLRLKVAKAMKKRRRRAAEKSQSRIAKRAALFREAVGEHADLRVRPRVAEGDPARSRELLAFVEAQVAEKKAQVERLFEKLEAHGADVTSFRHAPDLHALRVAVKHWRYTSEMARSVVPRVLYRPMAARLRRLQEAGGKSQDFYDLERLVYVELDRLGVSAVARRPLLSAIRAARRRAATEFVDALGARLPAEKKLVTAV